MTRKKRNMTHAQEAVILRTGRDLPELLHELYIERRMTQVAIAKKLGITRLTVAAWLREFEIPPSAIDPERVA